MTVPPTRRFGVPDAALRSVSHSWNQTIAASGSAAAGCFAPGDWGHWMRGETGGTCGHSCDGRAPRPSPFVLTWSEQKTAEIASAHASHRPLSRDQRREALCVHARGASAWLRDAARRPSGSLAAQRSASPVKNAFTWADALRLARAILSGSTIRPVPAQAAFTSSNCCSSIYISVLAISGSVAIRTSGQAKPGTALRFRRRVSRTGQQQTRLRLWGNRAAPS